MEISLLSQICSIGNALNEKRLRLYCNTRFSFFFFFDGQWFFREVPFNFEGMG